MKTQILNRFTGNMIVEGEMSVRELVLHYIKVAKQSGKVVDLSGADLSRTDLSRTNLSRTNLYGADLYGADLSEANLSEANLYEANLSGANLSRTNLKGANLYGANLSRTDLYGANLSEANLYGANLSGANLSEANLDQEKLLKFFAVGPIGSRDDYLQVFITPKQVVIKTGCFSGTLKQFQIRTERADYKAVLPFIKKMAAIARKGE